jgi:hypothetical protein
MAVDGIRYEGGAYSPAFAVENRDVDEAFGTGLV